MTIDWWNLDIDIVDHETLHNAWPDISGFRNALSTFDTSLTSYTHYDTMTKVLYMHYGSYRLTALQPDKWLKNYFGPRFAEVAPMFDKMYDSADLITSPLKNRDFSITHTGTVSEDGNTTYDNSVSNDESQAASGYNNMTGTSKDETSDTKSGSNTNTASSSNTSSGSNKFSDTPQGAVTNLTNGYLTNVTLTDDTGSDSSTSTDESSSTATGEKDSSVEQNNNYLDTYNRTSKKDKTGTDSTENVKTYDDVMTYSGYDNVNVSKLLQAYRETLININADVVKSFEDMFLLVYDWDVDE